MNDRQRGRDVPGKTGREKDEPGMTGREEEMYQE
jgi:hypothetical protein